MYFTSKMNIHAHVKCLSIKYLIVLYVHVCVHE